MKISVVTVSYNSAETIADCIDSVLSQNYPNIEFIIVDGKSTDGTMDIVNRFADRIQTIVSEPDQGIYDAMNKGISMCTGDVIGILNSDDLYEDAEVISDVVKQLKESGADSCYGDLVYVDQKDTGRVVRSWKAGEYRREKFLNGWMPPHPTFFLKRECYEQFGKFNTGFRTSADYELMLRMLYKNDVSVTYLNRVVVRMRTGGQSNVSIMNRIKANLEDRRAWKENGISPGLLTSLKKPLSKLGQFFRR